MVIPPVPLLASTGRVPFITAIPPEVPLKVSVQDHPIPVSTTLAPGSSPNIPIRWVVNASLLPLGAVLPPQPLPLPPGRHGSAGASKNDIVLAVWLDFKESGSGG